MISMLHEPDCGHMPQNIGESDCNFPEFPSGTEEDQSRKYALMPFKAVAIADPALCR